MATITSSWTENQEHHASSSISSGSSATDSIDLADAGYIQVDIQIWITFGTSTDDGCTVEVFSDSNSGSSPDTIALTSLEIPNTDSETKKVTITVKYKAFVDVKVTNNDGSESVTYVGKYTGLKIAST